LNARDLVLHYLELSNDGRAEEARALEHPDIRFWLSGRLIVSGDQSAERHRKAAAGVHATFPGGYRLDIRSVLVDGGRVAVEAVGEGVLADGSRYTPQYAFFFDTADGLITEMREYIDTEYVGSIFRLPVKEERRG
jgi:ketosteroid isomerase-like protein